MIPSRAVCAIVLFALATPLSAQQSSPPVDSATATTIRQLLAITGTGKRMVQGIETMVPAQRAANPRIPAAFWDAFLARARQDTTELLEQMIPIYASHLTTAELEGLVRFYQTPLGRRLAEVLPLIMQESMQAGQSWGAAIGRQVAESLAQTGLQFPSP
ncbi:MAG TPA: DUF2059 domain-containing protein [Gemmatimonadales bacterium]|nr:DUF2059 domain-containing protein [Gemmatimonadales bacterium]